jgi:hypothetical protein
MTGLLRNQETSMDQYVLYDQGLSLDYLYAVLIGCVIYAIIMLIVLWLFRDAAKEKP